MESNFFPGDIIGNSNGQIQDNRVLQLISITLLTLSFILSIKLLVHLLFPNISSEYNEMTIIIASCLAVNISASLILYRYRMLMEYLEHRLENKAGNLHNTIKHFREEREERRRYAMELKRFEEKYRHLLDHVDEAVASLDVSGNFLEVNRMMAKLLGCPKEELLNLNLLQFLPKEGREKTVNALNQAVSKGECYLDEGWILRSDGKKLPVEFVGKRVEIADQTFIQGIFKETAAPR
jgi:PAS domain S-box-containing protein